MTLNEQAVANEALRAWLEDSCRASGVPFTVEDPETLRKLARLLSEGVPAARLRTRSKSKKKELPMA